MTWGASTHTSELILEGEYEDSEISEIAQQFVKYMRKKTMLDSIPAILSETEWVVKIKTWKESTSTSPSGFHLSHSKALVAPHDLYVETPIGTDFEKKRLQLIQWQIALINIAISNNYSYLQWKLVVNVMILKSTGDIWIHRLRVIHLYKHEYTLLLALKWRALSEHCVKNKLLNPGQYGGVPGRISMTPTVIEELQNKITRASKRPLVHTDYGDTACYDRIIMNMGGLIARTHGQHRSIVYINAKTLEEEKYVLKIQLKVTGNFYKHCILFLIYGSGQGAGNSPVIWCCMSSLAFEYYE